MNKTISTLLKLNKETTAEVYYVGAYVRDLIRRQKPNRIEVLIRNYPIRSVTQYLKEHGKVDTTNRKDPCMVFTAGDDVEVSIRFPRKIGHDGWHASYSLRDDAKTRDFTINALYLPVTKRVSTKHIIDFFNSRKDIKERRVRSVGNPKSQIKRDPGFAMRSIAMAAYLNYKLDTNLFYAIKTVSDGAAKMNTNDMRAYLIGVLLSKQPSKYLKIMHNSGVLFHVMPELDICYGVEQNEKYHKYDVFTHSVLACDNTERDLVLRLAALLHDVGKPQTRDETNKNGGAKVTFYSHEVVSARLAKKLLKRLGFDKDVVSKVCELIYLHMYNFEPGKWTEGALRRFIRKAKITETELDKLDQFPLFLVRRADRLANGYPHKEVSYRQELFQKEILKTYRKSNVFTINDLDIDGKVLMVTFRLKEGPTVGHVLNHLLSIVMDDQALNTRETLIDKASDYLSEALK